MRTINLFPLFHNRAEQIGLLGLDLLRCVNKMFIAFVILFIFGNGLDNLSRLFRDYKISRLRQYLNVMRHALATNLTIQNKSENPTLFFHLYYTLSLM
ncbi:MAG: hypothetical protein JWN83_1094 [Chitinophagaceae bacterium]|nr:hypothetical protein [Chitinophagaceae bacterium]